MEYEKIFLLPFIVFIVAILVILVGFLIILFAGNKSTKSYGIKIVIKGLFVLLNGFCIFLAILLLIKELTEKFC